MDKDRKKEMKEQAKNDSIKDQIKRQKTIEKAKELQKASKIINEHFKRHNEKLKTINKSYDQNEKLSEHQQYYFYRK
jgi:uncharacterized membrane-anchored protein YhcB (DUF1043 family)